MSSKILKSHAKTNVVKAISVGALILIIWPLLLWVTSKELTCINSSFEVPNYIIWIVAYLPLITLGIYLFKNGGLNLADRLVGTKYYRYFPILFYYDPKPKVYKFKKLAELRSVLQPGDILLQRQNRFLDTLILGQTSYFTHAAIYIGDYKNKKHIVFQAIGKKGVSSARLKAFSKCDEIAVLRFNADLPITNSQTKITPDGQVSCFLPIKSLNIDALEKELNESRQMQVEKSLSLLKRKASAMINKPNSDDHYACADTGDYQGGSVWDNKIVYVKDAKKFICDEIKSTLPGVSDIGKEEYDLYWPLVQDVLHHIPNKIDFSKYLKVIKEIALMKSMRLTTMFLISSNLNI